MSNLKILAIVLILMLIVLSIQVISGYQIVIRSSEKSIKISENSYTTTFNPLGGIDLSSDGCSVFLVISKDDFKNLNTKLDHHKVWKTRSIESVRNLKRVWNFTMTGGDIATTQSYIVIVHNNKIVFESGVVIDKDIIGIQNELTGWAEPNDRDTFLGSFENFEKVYMPIVSI